LQVQVLLPTHIIKGVSWVDLLKFTTYQNILNFKSILTAIKLKGRVVFFKKKKIQKHAKKLNDYFYFYFLVFAEKNEHTHRYSKRTETLNIYNFLVIYNNLNHLFLKKGQTDSNRILFLMFDYRKQLRCNFILENKLIKSFSTGFVLTYTNTFKKELKKKKHSKVLLLKFVIKLLENIYNNYKLIIKIKGFSKNFYKWLNFFKLNNKLNSSKYKDYVYYIFEPSFNLSGKQIKKIKSIKRRMKKKYIYSNPI
jgi:hypothetical protein